MCDSVYGNCIGNKENKVMVIVVSELGPCRNLSYV